MISPEIISYLEATALTYRNQLNDIYSNSWSILNGLDDTLTLSNVTKAAYRMGAEKGRGGRGSIFVFSSGNRGWEGFNCGYKPQANIPETIIIGAVDQDDRILNYSEGCPAVIATAYSSRAYQRNIVSHSPSANARSLRLLAMLVGLTSRGHLPPPPWLLGSLRLCCR